MAHDSILRSDRRAMRARVAAGDDTVVVAYVGRLAAEKGLDVALGAIREILSRASHDAGGPHPRIVFAVAGDGPYEEHCRRAVGGEAAVHFVGPLEGRALSEFYASADLFIFPSATDTFGNVLLEAMSSGLPVIGAGSGPTRELLAGGGGITFTPGRLDREGSWLSGVRSRPALASPVREIDRRQEQVQALTERARRCLSAGLDRALGDITQTRARLVALSPAATLDRGYAIVQHGDASVVRAATEVPAGEVLTLRFAHDQLIVTAEGTAP